jgi:hypothetical protein
MFKKCATSATIGGDSFMNTFLLAIKFSNIIKIDTI